jgi:hypothetical protein
MYPFSPNCRDFSGYNEAASWSEKCAVQCLYCDTELKPSRGLFDEDFCCRDHREKYFSSFRKALSDFGDIQEPPANSVSATTVPEVAGNSAPAPDPRTAGFQPITALPLISEAAPHGYQPELTALRLDTEIADREIAWSAVLDFEERPAELAAPSDGLGGEFLALSLETAGSATSSDSFPQGHTPGMFDEPISLAPAQLSLPSFAVSAGGPALAPGPADEHAELTLFCQEHQSAPVLNSEIAPVSEAKIPAFTPASEMLHEDDRQDLTPDSTEPYWGELYSDPEPEGVEFSSALSVAPEVAWRSVPVDRPFLAQGNLPVMMPPSLELASGRSANVPALSSGVELRPHLAPERATDFVGGDAADSPAVPRSHEPLKLTFGNLVKIKNWRVRITFAKPA